MTRGARGWLGEGDGLGRGSESSSGLGRAQGWGRRLSRGVQTQCSELRPSPPPLSHRRHCRIVPAWAYPEDPFSLPIPDPGTTARLEPLRRSASAATSQPGPNACRAHRPCSLPGPGSAAPRRFGARRLLRLARREARTAHTDRGTARQPTAPPADLAALRAWPAPRQAPSSSAPEAMRSSGPAGEKGSEGVAVRILTLGGQTQPPKVCRAPGGRKLRRWTSECAGTAAA